MRNFLKTAKLYLFRVTHHSQPNILSDIMALGFVKMQSILQKQAQKKTCGTRYRCGCPNSVLPEEAQEEAVSNKVVHGD